MNTRGSALQWAVAISAALVMLLLGLVVLALIGMGTGLSALLLGMVLAALPIPLLAALALWIDRYEKEPVWMLALAFLWGATGSVFFSLIFNDINGYLFTLALGPEAASVATGSLSAPFVEELAKGFALLVLFYVKKDEFDNVTDGILYAAMVGLGFTLTEDTLYFARSAAEAGLAGSLGTLAVRVIGVYAHSFFTAFTGMGLGIARETTKKPLKVIAPLLGLGAAMFFHFLWNTSGIFGAAGYFGVYLLVMVPSFLCVIGLVLFSQHRERKVIRANLTPYVQTGILPAADVEALCRFGGRTRALVAAVQAGGLGSWRRERRFHQAASELAFHRWRTGRGISRGAEADAGREGEYLEQLRTLRPA